MTHHTDLAGADVIVAEAQRDFAAIMRELYVPRADEVANSEQARNVFLQLIARTRRNEPEGEAVRKLAGMVGQAAKGVIVRALIRRVQRECVAPPKQPHDPLPRGVSTPVPGEDDRTPALGSPVNAVEDIAPDARPTTPLTPRPPIGPWNEGPWGESLPPTGKKPRGRR